ncbi:M20/M25/M40 family metallo-hydrolase [soil metagenome]
MKFWSSLAAASFVATLSAVPVHGQGKPDAATAAWWAQTTALASDGMEGRDTGSAAYERAAKYVAAQFQASGLKAAGEGGTYFQRVPLHQVDLDLAKSSVEVVSVAKTVPLIWMQETTLIPRAGLSADVTGEMVFVGYGVPDSTMDLHGKIAVFFNNTPAGLTAKEREGFAAKRAKGLTESGAKAIVSIDNPGAIEPFHWPAAYSRSVTIVSEKAPAVFASPLTIRVSAKAAKKLFANASGHAFAEILKDGIKGAPLGTFALGSELRVKAAVLEKEISSPNILAVLPGSDPALASEYVAVSAHLDGYGYGTPVLGDKLYNGALDDAAYVATLIELAKNLHGKAPARSILFCVFTGEEKGLLGSVYFTAHPTVPVKDIVADLNLDQLRPIFPLKILTMEGVDESTLGSTVKTLAAKYGIEIRPDLEPERNLFRRADNYSFVRVGVPIASFIFGYNAGSPEEVVYRDWYARRYHKPQDDLKTPIVWDAAGTFNRFYGDLAVTIADTAQRPTWNLSSSYAPKAKTN